MSREIKFRSWDPAERTMLIGDGITFEDKVFGGGVFDLNEILEGIGSQSVLEQYTGLKDKTGREIYEGDIVEFKVNGDAIFAVVEYDEGSARFVKKGDNQWLGGLFDKDLSSYASSQRVLGNVHENPELLRSGDQGGA